MERLIFLTLLTVSLATPAVLIAFDIPGLTERKVPMLEQSGAAARRDSPVAQARAEGYVQAARELLDSSDPADRARACRLIAQAETIRGGSAADLRTSCERD